MAGAMATEDVNVRGRLLQALAQADAAQRRIAFRRLKNENRPATLHAIVRALESGDDGLVASAASVLPVVGPCPEIHRELIRHLKSNPSAAARQACARELARTYSEPVHQRLIASLSDPDDGVVIVVCTYLGRLGGQEAVDALHSLLAHSSWQVRLCASSTLMELGVRGPLLVSTLEALAGQPEASAHDAQVAECAELIELRGDTYHDEHRLSSMQSLINRARTAIKEPSWRAA
jgi:HEAT repeat protein